MEELENKYEQLDDVRSLVGNGDADDTMSVRSKAMSVKTKYSDKSMEKIVSLERKLERERKERSKLMKMIEEMK